MPFTISFVKELANKQHDLDTDTLKVALYPSTVSFGPTTTGYSATNEVTGAGYTAGGEELDNVTVGDDGVDEVYFSADTVTWSAATFTFRHYLIYNSSNGNKAVAYASYPVDQTVTSGTYNLTFPATTGGAFVVLKIES